VQEAFNSDLSGNIAEHVGAEAVSAHERVWIGDAAVDVSLGGEVNDGVMALHTTEHGVLIANVGVDELAATIVKHIANARHVARVRKRVEDRDFVVGVGQQPTHVVRADESGRACDEKFHTRLMPSLANRECAPQAGCCEPDWQDRAATRSGR